MIKKILGKKEEKPEQEVKTVEPHSSQNGTTFGYTVEARVDHYIPIHPVIIPKQCEYSRDLILTEEWQQITFQKGNNPYGVPTADCGHDVNLFMMHGLLARTSAIALAYTLAAQHSQSSMTSIKIRICHHKLTYAHKVFIEGEPEELTEHFGKIDKLMTKMV